MLRHKMWDTTRPRLLWGLSEERSSSTGRAEDAVELHAASELQCIVIDDEAEAVKGADAHSGYRSNP
jgi:hypothetical protein